MICAWCKGEEADITSDSGITVHTDCAPMLGINPDGSIQPLQLAE